MTNVVNLQQVSAEPQVPGSVVAFGARCCEELNANVPPIFAGHIAALTTSGPHASEAALQKGDSQGFARKR